MSSTEHEPVVAFAELASELIGRAVSACTAAASIASEQSEGVSETPPVPQIKIQLLQSPQHPQEINFRVTDEGVGLPQTQAGLQRALASLARPLSSSAVQDTGLLLRTTRLEEDTVRRYNVLSSKKSNAAASPAQPPLLDIIEAPTHEAKLPAQKLTGTQASITFYADQVTPEAALGSCEELLLILSNMCPPAEIQFKAKGIYISGNEQQVADLFPNDNASSEFPPVTAVAPVNFVKEMAPHPLASQLTPSLRLKQGLLREFPSRVRSQTAQDLRPQVGVVADTLHFVGVGEAAIPRGCKWAACAGVVLQMPDNNFTLHRRQETSDFPNDVLGEGVGESSQGGGGSRAAQPLLSSHGITCEAEQTAASHTYLYKNNALQIVDKAVSAAALHKIDWSSHGFKLLGVDAAVPGPLAVTLRCEQPASKASIAAIVVHIYLPDVYYASEAGRGDGVRRGPPVLAGKYEGLLVRSAVEAALANLKEHCPEVVASRRDRSLARSLPLVWSSCSRILSSSVGEGVLEMACEAMGVQGPEGLESALQHGLEQVATLSLSNNVA